MDAYRRIERVNIESDAHRACDDPFDRATMSHVAPRSAPCRAIPLKTSRFRRVLTGKLENCAACHDRGLATCQIRDDPRLWGMSTIPKLDQSFLTARELAPIIRATPETIRRWARTRVIPCLRIKPKVVRFDLDAVRRALTDRAGRSEGGQIR